MLKNYKILNFPRYIFISIFILLTLFIFFKIFKTKIYAATIIVTSNANSGAGTLRQALFDAQNGDIIEFNLGAGSEIITITSTLTTPYGKNITIDGDNTLGSGTNITVSVESPGSSTYPAITIGSGSGKTSTLRNLTLRGGDKGTGAGGTIYMSSSGASLVLDNCIVRDGRARSGAGMWASMFNSLTILNSTFTNNTSQEYGAGARIDSFSGTVIITGSTFTNNTCTSTGGNYYGGALNFYNSSTSGTVNIDKTTISNNSVYMSGGGIYSNNIANFNISNSTINNNSTSYSTGGIVLSYGNKTITNTTITGNTGVYSGGITLNGGTSTLTNVTIVANNATSGNDDGLIIGNSENLYIKNCLLANQPNYDFTRSSGTVYDNGYNLVENSSGHTWVGTGDITGNQPNLNISDTLALNDTRFGTMTLALLEGSVAINAGNFAPHNGVRVKGYDQRGYYRNGAVDIGAYEYNGLSDAPTFTLVYSAGSHGSISGEANQVVELGEDGTPVSAVPFGGYKFINWSDSSTDNPRTDTNVSENISVTANFEINTYTLEYSTDGNGTISGETHQVVTHGSNGSPVEAIPKKSYHFLKWSDDITSNPRTDTNVTEDISVTAIFEINTYTLTYSAGPHGSIEGEAIQVVEHGSNGTPVTAVPDNNYIFVKWSDDSVEKFPH